KNEYPHNPRKDKENYGNLPNKEYGQAEEGYYWNQENYNEEGFCQLKKSSITSLSSPQSFAFYISVRMGVL
ncbi:MAG TPA: hypothetical protein VEI53_06330, partial [Ktedonobacteraceae bacterium]|nr:hypothetical protein [Ktedonobacteraceae bacterium]